jgi:hypothetical protein
MEELLKSLLDDAHSCPVQWGYFQDGQTLPRVTLVRMSGRREVTLNSLGFLRATVQVDCFAADFDELTEISCAIKSVAERIRQDTIVSTRLTGQRDSNNETGVHRTSLTFAITYRE